VEITIFGENLYGGGRARALKQKKKKKKKRLPMGFDRTEKDPGRGRIGKGSAITQPPQLKTTLQAAVMGKGKWFTKSMSPDCHSTVFHARRWLAKEKTKKLGVRPKRPSHGNSLWGFFVCCCSCLKRGKGPVPREIFRLYSGKKKKERKLRKKGPVLHTRKKGKPVNQRGRLRGKRGEPNQKKKKTKKPQGKTLGKHSICTARRGRFWEKKKSENEGGKSKRITWGKKAIGGKTISICEKSASPLRAQ